MLWVQIIPILEKQILFKTKMGRKICFKDFFSLEQLFKTN